MDPKEFEAEFHLIGDIYDAAMEPGLWPKVLQQIAKLSGSNSAIITALDQLNPDYTLAFTHNIPEEPFRVYREKGLDVFEMEVIGKPMIRNGIGSTVLSSEMYGTQEDYVRLCGDLYQLCMKPANIHYMAGALLDHGDFRWGAMGIHRPADWAPLTSDHAALLGRLSTHVRRALQIHRQLTSVRHHNARLYRMLDGLVAGVILLNSQGLIRYANAKAESMLGRHGALRATVREGLQAAQFDQDVLLQNLIQSAVSAGQRECHTTGSSGVIGLQTAYGGHPLMLTVTPLSELTGYNDLASDNIAAAVFLTDPTTYHVLSRKLLKQSYGLSERESDVCEAFVNHATLENTATACGLSLASVRSYMKEIYEKTGQHSQAELMRLLMGLTLDFEHIL